MERPNRQYLAVLGMLLSVAIGAAGARGAAPLAIDNFAYGDTAAARAAWMAVGGSTAVDAVTTGPWGSEPGVKFTLDFSQPVERRYWDRAVSLDLSGYRTFSLRVWFDNPAAVDHFTLYFRTGGTTWYTAGMVPARVPGWQTMEIPMSAYTGDAGPASWGAIDRIRLSPWRDEAATSDSLMVLGELRATMPEIIIYHSTKAQDSPGSRQYRDAIVQAIEPYGVEVTPATDVDVEQGYLAGSKLAILPLNHVSTTETTRLQQFVAGGGKLMVFYSGSAAIDALVGMKNPVYLQGDFPAYRFHDAQIPGLPDRVVNDSWNIRMGVPDPARNARVIATWEDAQGNLLPQAAWIASDGGFVMAHVFLGGDERKKERMLLAMIDTVVPGTWAKAAIAALERLEHYQGHASFDAAVAAMTAAGEAAGRAAEVGPWLTQAASRRALAQSELGQGRTIEALTAAEECSEALREAFYRCQAPAWPEFRAVWEHSGAGVFEGDWDASAEALAKAGFTHVFPNSLRAGLAHYASDLIPRSAIFAEHGDQIEQAVRAGHKHGLQVHVWKVNFNLSQAPQTFIDQMRAAGRTQKDWNGVGLDWLCPSHPENIALERDTMLEVATKYAVDGLHFDYIRYNGRQYCYCDGCRARFQQQTGETVTAWPADCVPGGRLEREYQAWRIDKVTEVVKAVHDAVKAVRPEVEFSAAVGPEPIASRETVGRDWDTWIARGYLDFLCPMTYRDTAEEFKVAIGQAIAGVAGRVPVYPGIGVSSSNSRLEPDETIMQIGAAREAGTGGFILFNYTRAFVDSLFPALSLGTTAPRESGVRDWPAIDR